MNAGELNEATALPLADNGLDKSSLAPAASTTGW